MTFGALAAWQAWALLVMTAAVAAALFFMKLRAPRAIVPSLLLWRRVLDETRDLTLWERIRRAVSLALTVMIAVLLAAAVARPARSVEVAHGAGTGRLFVVLDSSWSMQARTRSGETRWTRAVAEARRLFAGSAGREMALATTADGLVEGPTTDAALLDAALERVAPSGGDRTAWPPMAGAAAVHFVTDGATARVLDPDVVVHSVFDPAPNVAILAFRVRPSLDAARGWDAYLEVANFAPAAQTVRVTLERGSALLFDQPLDVAAAGVLRQVVPLGSSGDPVVTARVRAERNAIALDDEAVAWMSGARPLAVTVVSASPDWLVSAFQRAGDVEATAVTPEAYASRTAAGTDARDALVFDGWAPETPPSQPALLFSPPPLTPWLSAPPPADVPAVATPAAEERRPRWDAPGNHPLVEGVDPYTLVIERARAYTHPALEPVAISSRGTPLVSVREDADVRAVLVAFGPADSNVASAPGFPVLLANALEWLTRPAPVLPTTRAEGMRPGRVAAPGLVAFIPSVRRLSDPRGRHLPLLPLADRSVAVVTAPGLYSAEGTAFRSLVAVNAGDPELSDTTRSTLAGSRNDAPTAAEADRPWWIYCALAAFGLILAEWWTWQRRITI